MATVIALVPCLMLENNRAVNIKSINTNYKEYNFDKFIVYDQKFTDADKSNLPPDIVYIGNTQDRMGWVIPRNDLLNYFYNSNYDYAFWIDANSTVSGTTVNDLVTIIDAIKHDKLNFCDSIFATLGLWPSSDRINCKKQDDYSEKVMLTPTKNDKSYNWMHGLIMKNYNKYYDQRFLIDSRCDTRLGTPDDVYFARLIRKYTKCYLAASVCLNKPSSKMSCTWANEKGTYDYPPVLYDIVDQYILDESEKHNYHECKNSVNPFMLKIPRLEYKKDCIKPYKPKFTKQTRAESISQQDLFGGI